MGSVLEPVNPVAAHCSGSITDLYYYHWGGEDGGVPKSNAAA